MSSTNINIGRMEDARNSSRVLKPPGGGHSDIFGIYDQRDQQTPKVKYNQPRSTINEVFGGTEPDYTANKQKIEEEHKEEEENANENEAPPKPIPTPQRTRVPPGGFSSGLW